MERCDGQTATTILLSLLSIACDCGHHVVVVGDSEEGHHIVLVVVVVVVVVTTLSLSLSLLLLVLLLLLLSMKPMSTSSW